jgi:formylglycine-generating enzyme required for sulfatase activity
MDTYEASVWRVPDPASANTRLVAKIKNGTATLAALTAGGATLLGTPTDHDYTPCKASGEHCTDVYAVSLPGVVPSAAPTWFQAQQACANAGKRLPSSAEWQAAVADTPDPGPDNGATDCNTASAMSVVPAGSRSGCVSADGAFDMVGNLSEWVADWVQRSTGSGTWSAGVSPTGDRQDLVGALVPAVGTEGEPGALLRGGSYADGPKAGPLAVTGGAAPSVALFAIGFRCAR